MAKSVKELSDERMKLVSDNRKLLESATDGKLTAEQRDEWDKRDAEIERLTSERNDLLNADSLKDRAKRYEEFDAEEPRRQTGRNQPREQEPQTLSIDIGKHKRDIPRGSRLAARATPEYLTGYDQYLIGDGDNPAKLGLQVGKDSKGGYAVPMVTQNRLIKFVDNFVFMRQLATVLPPIEEAKSLGAVSYDTDPGDGDWTAEIPASDISEDDSMTFGHREMIPHLLTKLVKASDQFLKGAANLPGGASEFIGDRLGYKFAVTEEKAFLTGSGSQQPLGVFTASDNGVSTSQDFTCSSATAFSGDDVVNSLYALKVQYQERATGLFSRTFVKRTRTLKDGTGAYLWAPGLQAGQPDRIFGRPYVQSEYVPSTFTTGLYVGMWADFSWYWIVDALDTTIQRLGELFQLKNQIGFLARRRLDGMPVLAEAFSRLKLA